MFVHKLYIFAEVTGSVVQVLLSAVYLEEGFLDPLPPPQIKFYIRH